MSNVKSKEKTEPNPTQAHETLTTDGMNWKEKNIALCVDESNWLLLCNGFNIKLDFDIEMKQNSI